MGTLTWDKEIQGFSATGYESGGEGTDDHPWGEDWMQKVIAAQWGETGLIWVGDSQGGTTALNPKDMSIVEQTVGGDISSATIFENVSCGMWCRTAADPVNGQPLWLLGGAKADFTVSGVTPPLIMLSTDGGINIFAANMPSFGFKFNDGTPNQTANVDAFSYDTSSGTMYARAVGSIVGGNAYYVISSGDGMNWNIVSGPTPFPPGVLRISAVGQLPGIINAPPTTATNKLARVGFPDYLSALGSLKSTTPGKSGGTYIATANQSGTVQFTNIKDGTGFSSSSGLVNGVSAINWVAGKFIAAGDTGAPSPLVWTDDGKTWHEIDNVTTIQAAIPFPGDIVGIAAGPKQKQ